MFKKTTLAIFGLATCGFASAGMYAPAPAPTCTPGDVTVPCEAKKWDLGVQALYLQPVYSANRGYEYDAARHYSKAEPKWDWGYRLEGSYHFNTGNDITMTWMHYNAKTERATYSALVPMTESYLPFEAELDNKFDQVNLVLGQHTDMGLVKNARFYGGLQYARIRFDSNNEFNLSPQPALMAAAPFTGINQYRNSVFYGVGPVIGVDYSYDLTSNFSITANSATSILVGNRRYSHGYVLAPTGVVLFGLSNIHQVVVPSMEAKLGVNYAAELAQGTFNIEAGYQAVNYFNVFETRDSAGFQGVQSSSNFGLYGPYLGVKWVANV